MERHTGGPSCPICREAEYQALAVNDAAVAHLEASATVLQAAWRGRAARVALAARLAPEHPGHPLVRAQRARELAAVSDRLMAALPTAGGVDAFLAEIDASTSASRAAVDAAVARAAAREPPPEEWAAAARAAEAREAEKCAICLGDVGPGCGKRRSLLTCSHVLHTACIASLEAFGTAGTGRSCPVCRQRYARREIVDAERVN